MHLALLLLLRLRFKGLLRRLGRGVRTPSGVLLALFGVFMLAMWIGPMVFGAILAEPRDAAFVGRYGPPVLCVILLANILSRHAQPSTQFSRAEIDLLFPAPFRRWELLGYRAAIMLATSLGLGVMFSLCAIRLDTPWISAFLSAALAMFFINLASMAASMAREPIGRALRTPLRLAGTGAVLVTVLAAFIATLPIDPEAELPANVHAVLDAPATQAILLPFTPFTGLFLADSPLPFVFHLMIVLAMVAAMFLLIVALDARTIDATVQRSLEYQKALEQAKKPGGTFLRVRPGAARRRIPPLPWLGGAGPILWKQLTTAMRSISNVAMAILIPLAVFTTLLIFTGEDAKAGGVTFLAVLFTAIISISLLHMLLFDFRAELGHMDWLKMLPIRPLPLTIGQVLTPVLIMTLVQWAMLAVGLAAGAQPGVLLAVAALIVPFNALSVAIENAGFLLYPTRVIGAGLADLVSFSRTMLLFMVRSFVLAATAGAAALLGFAGYWLAGSWVAFVIVMWLALVAAVAGVLPVVAAIFHRFDVSRDLPA